MNQIITIKQTIRKRPKRQQEKTKKNWIDFQLNKNTTKYMI